MLKIHVFSKNLFFDITCRHDRGPISRLFSVESNRTRHRARSIGIQICFIAWGIEFISGVLVLIDEMLGITNKGVLDAIFVPLYIFMSSVLIPSTYCLNIEKVKQTVIADGWMSPLRRVNIFSRNRISPREVIPMEVLPNAPQVRASLPPRIPTISEHI